MNGRSGLEHGFTVPARPAGPVAGETLNFTLAVRGSLRVAVAPDGQAARFLGADGAAALVYGGLKVWDAEGKMLPARMAATPEGGLRLEVEEGGARYPLTVDPIVQQAYLKASNTGEGDRFGNSVAVWGDTVVVGAPNEASSTTGINSTPDEGATNSGAAYVFVRSGTTWTQQAYLKASNTGNLDQFGWSVAVSGDTVVVGAYLEASNATGVNGNQADNSASSAGAAYVFTRSGTTWTQQAYLKASNTGAGDLFGYSVAVSGDTVVVGARFEASNATGVNGNQADDSAGAAGAAYVFTRSGTTWTQQAYLKASNTEADDRFGFSVAVSGDTVVVGACFEDSNATGVNGNQADNSASLAGAAYVFTRSGTTWTQQAYLKASNTGGSDWFGYAVAVSGDTVVVGANREASNATGVNGNQADNSASLAGAAYVFTRSGTTWTQQAYLKASNTGGSDEFGYSVAVSGDTVVVGAYGEDSNATGVNGNQADNLASFAGAAYVFTRSGTTWTQQAYLKASNTGAVDEFGYSVAVSGDTVVVGAPREDSSTSGVNSTPNELAGDSGAAYTFLVPNPVTIERPAGTPLADETSTDLGSVALGASGTAQTFTIRNSDTVDRTGLTIAVTGANAGDFTVSPPSSTTVPAGGSVTFTVTFTPGGPDARTCTLSYGVDTWPARRVRLTGTGASAALLRAAQQAYVKPSNTGGGDWFGYAVAVSGDTVVVGAPREASSTTGINSTPNEDAPNSGAAYVFVRSGTTWTQQAYLKASNTGAGYEFGWSVAVSGDTVVVGARGERSNATGVNGNQADNLASFAGAAYVFTRSGTTWTQQAYLKASNTEGNDQFGWSVAVSGDTVVVGAYLEDSNATGVNGNQADNSASFAGAAYVFTRSGTAWTQQAYLKASNTGGGDEFGNSVAVSGDTVVVGAWGEASNATGVNANQADNSASLAGAAYVFTRSGTTWTQQAYLKASNTGTGDTFGTSVAVSGDTVVVGARGERSNATGVNGNQADNSASSAGAAYVFTRSGTTWTQQAYLKASNTGTGDTFGTSVAVSGDTVVVGAWGEASNATGVNGNQANNSASEAGAAYVFTRSGTTWTQQAYLKASNTGANDQFGISVAVSGDTVVVGAFQEDSSTSGVNSTPNELAGESGAAYVFAAPIAPQVTAPTFANMSTTTATLGGTVSSDGGAALTARGVIYARTADNPNPQLGGPNVTVVTEGGTTLGAFTTNVTGLATGTDYSFVAYATNSAARATPRRSRPSPPCRWGSHGDLHDRDGGAL